MPRSIRGTRAIVVDGHALRWRIGDHLRDSAGVKSWVLRLIAFSGDGGTSRLTADIDPEGETRHILYKVSHVSPHYVEAIIRHALNHGWDPSSRAPDVRIDDTDPILGPLLFPRSYLRVASSPGEPVVTDPPPS